MTEAAPPPYEDIQFSYPYAKLFLLLHNPMTSTPQQIAAYGNLLELEHRTWLGVLIYQANQSNPAAPLICPSEAYWTTGFNAAKIVVDAFLAGDPVPDLAAFLASVNVSMGQYAAGVAFYAYKELSQAPMQPSMGLLPNVLYFALNL